MSSCLSLKKLKIITSYVCLNHWHFVKICSNNKKNDSVFHFLFVQYCTSISWKVHKLTKILLWNVTKWGLFFILVLLVVHTFSISDAVFGSIVQKKLSKVDMMPSCELFCRSLYNKFICRGIQCFHTLLSVTKNFNSVNSRKWNFNRKFF